MVLPADGLSGVTVLTGLALWLFGFRVQRRFDSPGVTPFAAFAVLLGLAGISGSLLGATTGSELWPEVGTLFWGVSTVPWLLFALQYTGRSTRTEPRTVALLFAPCVGLGVSLVMLAVDASSVVTALVGALSVLYCLMLVLAGGVLLIRTGYRYGHLRIGPGVILTVAPIATFVTLNFGSQLVREQPDTELAMTINASGFVVAAVALVAAVGYYRVFEVTPPAVGTLGEREIVRESDDLVFVVSNEDDVVRINETALVALGWSREAAQQTDLSALLGHGTDALRDRETVRLETTEGTRRYDPQVSPLTGGDGRTLGALVSLRDVTARQLREQRLSVLNRVLRHNLRNRVQVLRAHTEALERESNDTDDHTTPMLDALDELTEVGEAARDIDEFVASEIGWTTVDVVAVVDETLQGLGPESAPVTVSVERPESAEVATSHRALSTATESAIENALEYAESSVTVGVRETPEGCTVRIADDGPGIPDSELDSLDRGVETPLQHTTGLGLWQLKWAVTTLGGELSFDTTDGTTVEFTVPDHGRGD
ncbi:MAG: signal transduction histidine kinase [Halovenus sp.]|jgi:signal transduction histidine kinase